MAKNNEAFCSYADPNGSKPICCCTSCRNGNGKIGEFTFSSVVLGSGDEYLYELKSPIPVRCSGCNHYITTTSHSCRFYDLFKPNQWIQTNNLAYEAVRSKNFKRILKIMVDSGQLVLCDRVANHLLKNVFTSCPGEESFRLKAGDKYILPPIACKNCCARL